MSKTYATLADVRKEQDGNPDKCLIVIEDGVYDAKSFLFDHPGGPDAITDMKGMDATSAFEAVGHSKDARTTLKGLKVGTLANAVKSQPKKETSTKSSGLSEEERKKILEEGRREMNRWTFKHDILPIVIAATVGYAVYSITTYVRHR